MTPDQKVFKLQGKVQHYAWGGFSFLPQLLHIDNSDRRPFAEYWLGAHENASAELEGVVAVTAAVGGAVPAGSTMGATAQARTAAGDAAAARTAGVEGPGGRTAAGDAVAAGTALNSYIRQHPEDTLGPHTAARFGRLPYLLKILDVKDMLSIQVHPTKRNAELEFAEENRKGIPFNAPHRNYKDDNHKPELMLALGEFWLLHGFKPEQELLKTLHSVPELRFLLPVFKRQGYQGVYQTVMELPQKEVNALLAPLLGRIIPLYKEGQLKKHEEDFWAARAALTYDEPEKTDRGIFSIYLFNLVNLHTGEAIFQDAGLPHAYLEGQNVEIMANSDNVLRGGLTPKHVDVPELMKHVRFEPTIPRIITGGDEPGRIAVYHTPAPDFELSKLSLLQGESLTIRAHSAEIYLVLQGSVGVIEPRAAPFGRKRGEAFVAFHQAKFELKAQEDAVVYRASVPAGAL
ncbi:MAG TPA: mannose-6-phosphate isomerase, class I [Puia sp.]|nr:mannose-6-phosphate isomerase, class I [Puia sp.]